MAKIKVATTNRKKAVDAIVIGMWAVHRRLPHPTLTLIERDSWAVTHVKSGRCVGVFYRTEKLAMSVAEKMNEACERMGARTMKYAGRGPAE